MDFRLRLRALTFVRSRDPESRKLPARRTRKRLDITIFRARGKSRLILTDTKCHRPLEILFSPLPACHAATNANAVIIPQRWRHRIPAVL